MRYKLIFPGRFPGLNEYISAERANKHAAAGMKRDIERQIVFEARLQFCVRFKTPVFMRYTWYEPNKRRDKDNIAFAKKFIQDAFVSAGILEDDGWEHVVGFTDMFAVDAKNPRVEVIIEELEKEVG